LCNDYLYRNIRATTYKNMANGFLMFKSDGAADGNRCGFRAMCSILWSLTGWLSNDNVYVLVINCLLINFHCFTRMIISTNFRVFQHSLTYYYIVDFSLFSRFTGRLRVLLKNIVVCYIVIVSLVDHQNFGILKRQYCLHATIMSY